jgi:hypothetical protein
MDSESSSFAPRGRRVRTILAALAIAGLSAGFTACDDEDVDNAQDQIDSVQSQAEEFTDSVQSGVDTDELKQDIESQTDEAQEQINSAIDEAQQGN